MKLRIVYDNEAKAKKENIEIIALSSNSKKGFYKERNKPTEIY